MRPTDRVGVAAPVAARAPARPDGGVLTGSTSRGGADWAAVARSGAATSSAARGGGGLEPSHCRNEGLGRGGTPAAPPPPAPAPPSRRTAAPGERTGRGGPGRR